MGERVGEGRGIGGEVEHRWRQWRRGRGLGAAVLLCEIPRAPFTTDVVVPEHGPNVDGSTEVPVPCPVTPFAGEQSSDLFFFLFLLSLPFLLSFPFLFFDHLILEHLVHVFSMTAT